MYMNNLMQYAVSNQGVFLRIFAAAGRLRNA